MHCLFEASALKPHRLQVKTEEEEDELDENFIVCVCSTDGRWEGSCNREEWERYNNNTRHPMRTILEAHYKKCVDDHPGVQKYPSEHNHCAFVTL